MRWKKNNEEKNTYLQSEKKNPMFYRITIIVIKPTFISKIIYFIIGNCLWAYCIRLAIRLIESSEWHYCRVIQIKLLSLFAFYLYTYYTCTGIIILTRRQMQPLLSCVDVLEILTIQNECTYLCLINNWKHCTFVFCFFIKNKRI